SAMFNLNQAVTFRTGHDATGAMPDGVDWAGIARSSPVIVMYMAMKHIGLIAGRLIEAGRSPDEPVAFVCNASLPDQTVLETTLGRAAIEVEAAGLQPPAIVVVGEVVRFACRAGLDRRNGGKSLVSDPLGKRTQQGVQSA
ncbi:SAM-dependent methyltransferase, partial [Brucella abortus]|nr:SAM-dependent methyltransferase [Brucella abortus]